MALARINDDRAGKVSHIRMLTCTLGENSKRKSAKGGMMCGQLLFDRLSDMAFEFLPLVSNSFKMF